MDRQSKGPRDLEAYCSGGQGPPRAVAPTDDDDSTNIGTEYFKHALYSPFLFSSKCSLFQNANLFGSCIIHILYTGCDGIKKKIPAPKGYCLRFQRAPRKSAH